MSDIDVTKVTIDGTQYNADLGWTSGDIAKEYRDALSVFVEVFNADPNNFPETLDGTPTNELMENAIAYLKDLAATGVQHSVDQSDKGNQSLPEKTYYFTVEMARDLDLLIKTLKAAGATDLTNISLDVAKAWKSLAAQSPVIAEVITSAVASSTEGNASVQSLIEMDYIRTGNDVLAEKMEDLESALGTTKDVLNTLHELQVVHNKITAKSKGIFAHPNGTAFAFNPVPNLSSGEQLKASTFQKLYQEAASAFFGNPINPEVLDNTTTFNNGLIADLKRLRLKLIAQRDELDAITPDVDPNQEQDSLLGKLKVVLKDLNDLFLDNNGQVLPDAALIPKAREWIIDKYNLRFAGEASKSGDIQQNLTFAITAGESLNDTQKEEVRRFLFVFEEYYKSASTILAKITQIIEKMAQGVSR